MAVVAKINTTTGIGRATVKQPIKTIIAAQDFKPKLNVSVSEVQGISVTGVQNNYTFIYNSDSGQFETKPAADLTGTITQITGGTF